MSRIPIERSAGFEVRKTVSLVAVVSICASVLLGEFDRTGHRRLNLEHVGSQQGFPFHVVRGILQDRYGFLWIGTNEGLARYDGIDFRVFMTDPEAPKLLSRKKIYAMYEDPSGSPPRTA